jgi:hypothetical protein
MFDQSIGQNKVQKEMLSFWDLILARKRRINSDFEGPVGQTPFFPLWQLEQIHSKKSCTFLVPYRLWLRTMYYVRALKVHSHISTYQKLLEYTIGYGYRWSHSKNQYVSATYRPIVEQTKVYYLVDGKFKIPYEQVCPMDENMISGALSKQA